MNPKYWLFAFAVLSFLNLVAEFSGSKFLIYGSKPFLMVTLAAWFWFSSQAHQGKFRNWIFLGFILSIFGDTFLMFVENNPEAQLFFILGLGSFLLTHIFYLIGFLSFKKNKSGLLKRKPLLLLPFLTFLILNLLFLWPDIPADLKIPVTVYSTAIVAMAMACLNLFTKIPSSIFKILFGGVLLFIFSDSIIGINKFKAAEISLPYPRLLIMIPYLLGQYLIAKGSLAALSDE